MVEDETEDLVAVEHEGSADKDAENLVDETPEEVAGLVDDEEADLADDEEDEGLVEEEECLEEYMVEDLEGGVSSTASSASLRFDRPSVDFDLFEDPSSMVFLCFLSSLILQVLIQE